MNKHAPKTAIQTIQVATHEKGGGTTVPGGTGLPCHPSWGGTIVPPSTGWPCHPAGRYSSFLWHGTTVPVSIGSPCRISGTSLRRWVTFFAT